MILLTRVFVDFMLIIVIYGSRNNSVGIVARLSYSWAIVRDSFLIQNVHTVSRANKIIRWVPGKKRPVREVDHSVTYKAEFKDEWIFTFTIHVSPYGVDKEELHCDLSIFHVAKKEDSRIVSRHFRPLLSSLQKICTLLWGTARTSCSRPLF